MSSVDGHPDRPRIGDPARDPHPDGRSTRRSADDVAPMDRGPRRAGPRALEELRDRVDDLADELAGQRTDTAQLMSTDDGLRSLRRELFADPGEDCDQPLGAVTDLQRSYDHLAGELQQTREQNESRTPILPNWAEMDRPTADAAWRHLVDWLLGVFVVRYPSSAEALQPCWFQHPEVVENLSWLHNAWTVAFRSADSPVALAADWHTAWLPRVVAVMKSEFRPCYTNQIHSLSQRRDLLRENVVGIGEDLDRHRATDLHHRPAARDATTDPVYVATPPPVAPRPWSSARTAGRVDGTGGRSS